MEAYDDRPASVYDNLNATTTMHTSTPKSKATPTSPSLASTSTSLNVNAANGATRSPIYTDLSFKFMNNNNNNNNNSNHKYNQPQQQHYQQQPQQQQQQQPLTQQSHTHLLPNGNSSTNRQHQQTLPSQVQPNYATPFKPTIMNANTATTTTPATPLLPQMQSTVNNTNAMPITATSPTTGTGTGTLTKTEAATAAPPQLHQHQQQQLMTAAAISTPTATVTNASPAQRPLSQHSQSESNEASQSIAAVKAALNDAKSKFFGLNGYAQNHFDNPSNESRNETIADSPSPTKVQIRVKPIPPPKPQPKYQNIPENSAIFRQQWPNKVLDNATMDRQYDDVIFTSPVAYAPHDDISPSGHRPSEPSGPSYRIASIPASSMSTSTPVGRAASRSQSPPPSITIYKQIPLNDIVPSSSPSQAVYMSTTVPQNIKGSKIAGRHTPTRNSLRHSRMLVVNNKNFQDQHPNPMNFKKPNLARWLLILEIIIGLLLVFLSIWIFFLAPNTAIQDNPYWSGLALLISGVVGLVLVRYQRIKRHKVREKCFLFLRADSYLLSLLAVLLCCVALICASIHFARLTASDTKCVSADILLEHGSCSCTFNAFDNAAAAESSMDNAPHGLLRQEEVPDGFDDRSYTVEYRDLSCNEVTGAWTRVLGLSIALNGLGFLIALCYIVLLACCRYTSKRFYTSVQTSTF